LPDLNDDAPVLPAPSTIRSSFLAQGCLSKINLNSLDLASDQLLNMDKVAAATCFTAGIYREDAVDGKKIRIHRSVSHAAELAQIIHLKSAGGRARVDQPKERLLARNRSFGHETISSGALE